MSRKSILGIILAALVFGAILLTIETSISAWQLMLGFVIFWPITLGYINLKNAFALMSMTLMLLLSSYLAFKFSCFGVVPGAILGISIGLIMHFGWITQHKPFSRMDYVKSQNNMR